MVLIPSIIYLRQGYSHFRLPEGAVLGRGGSGIGEVVRPMIEACPSEAQRASAEVRSADQSAQSAEKIFHVFILAMKKHSHGISTHFMFFCS